MPIESSIKRFTRVVVRGWTLIVLAAACVLLFVVADIANGPDNQHGLRLVVSNGVWALFLIGCVLLIALAVTVLVQSVVRRAKRTAPTF
jgi:formate-dependent nitrite reductase membrane component NrfD